jgi:hypothetical protein
MCPTDHDATCTAVLTQSKTGPRGLVASLVCESCNQVIKVIGFVEHTVEPVINPPSPAGDRG